MATEEDKVNTGALITLVGVSTFAMVAVTLAVTAIARDEVSQARAAKEGSGATAYNDLKRSQLASLANGVTIERSMQSVVQQLARDPSSATPPTAGASAAPSAAGGAAAGGVAAAEAQSGQPSIGGKSGSSAPTSGPLAPGTSGVQPAASGQPAPSATAGSAGAAPSLRAQDLATPPHG